MFYILKNRLLKGVVTKPIGIDSMDAAVAEEINTSGQELSEAIKKQFGRSFNVRQVDTGSCGACMSEIATITNPLYDVQRFGVNFVASPRHADALLVTGPVSKNMLFALKKTYEAMPKPNFVITLGDCAHNGGVFNGSYYVHAGLEGILPVAFHIPGCPPRPKDIIIGLLKFIGGLQAR